MLRGRLGNLVVYFHWCRNTFICRIYRADRLFAACTGLLYP